MMISSMRSATRKVFVPITRASFSSQATPIMSYVRHPYSLNGKPIDLNCEKDSQQFAIVDFQGTQHKVTQGDSMLVDKIEDIDIGEKIIFDKVLLVGSKLATYIGRPYLSGATVSASVEEKLKDKKVIIFKKRRRKNSQRTWGYRREICVLRVEGVNFDHAASK
mmetsp:Transcript_17011/g.28377  ORF Transcript_17011/g.28377 Transcript_17011/m.28377 type:complete len:164 (+) Transcript_17011:41-532(+)